MSKLRVSEAAERLGVHPQTLRRWAESGQVPSIRINARGDRRFEEETIDALALGVDAEPEPVVEPVLRAAAYVRVSGRGDQLHSLKAQEEELREAAPTELVSVYSDVASGLSERRKGLTAALAAASRREYDLLWVTHTDRLARFGVKWLTELFAAHGVEVRVLHGATSAGVEAELMEDFMALIASFSGRLYGQRSAAARARLLARVSSEEETTAAGSEGTGFEEE